MVAEILPPQFNYHLTYLLTVSPFCPSLDRESPVYSEGLGWLRSVSPVPFEGLGLLHSVSTVHAEGLE